MSNSASCSCGQLKVTLLGDPIVTAVCNCRECQKRTGSAFGVGAYYLKDQVINTEGTVQEYEHLSDDQKKFTRNFCGTCGTSVFWEAEFQPGLVGIAVGCFENPNFTTPKLACWMSSKLNWVEFPDNWTTLENQ